jgi:hypothetical protein
VHSGKGIAVVLNESVWSVDSHFFSKNFQKTLTTIRLISYRRPMDFIVNWQAKGISAVFDQLENIILFHATG